MLGAGVTFIATCRRREAGGRYRGTIAKQLIHLGAALRAGCEWYDLEIESASRCPCELLDVLLGEGRQICSAHFFQARAKRFQAGGRHVVECAVGCDQDCSAVRITFGGTARDGDCTRPAQRDRSADGRRCASDARPRITRTEELYLRARGKRHGSRPGFAQSDEESLSR